MSTYVCEKRMKATLKGRINKERGRETMKDVKMEKEAE
jgi:hypothetical protein